MTLSETFQVAAIIEKLPPAWKDLKNYLKYKRNEMKIENLIVRLRIEEDNKGLTGKWGIPLWPRLMWLSMVKAQLRRKHFLLKGPNWGQMVVSPRNLSFSFKGNATTVVRLDTVLQNVVYHKRSLRRIKRLIWQS